MRKIHFIPKQSLSFLLHFNCQQLSRFKVGSAPDIQYLASGGSDDWARGAMGIKWVFLVELPDRGKHGFLLPRQQIGPVAKSAMAAVRAATAEVSYTIVK